MNEYQYHQASMTAGPKDDNTLQIFRKAIEPGGRTVVSEKDEDIANIDDDSGRRVQTKEAKERRLKGAYNLLEANSYEPIIVETNGEQKLYQIKSKKDKDKSYKVKALAKTCTSPDFDFRGLKCKHITVAEILDKLGIPRHVMLVLFSSIRNTL